MTDRQRGRVEVVEMEWREDERGRERRRGDDKKRIGSNGRG